MNKRILSLAFLLTFGLSFLAKADEGMWLPMLVKRLNYTDMQKKGLKLTAEEIYDVNNSSLKDAIVQLGGFCTAEFISKEGLLLTNHHCAYNAIQGHSTTEHDYLKDGFWAMTREQELSNPGLFVDILVRMEDVTSQVLEGVDNNTPDADRAKMTGAKMKAIADAAKNNGQYVAYVRDFFAGNEYYLFVYERFNDVRLVGAPPSSIGKFGGDTDNWMWPRHTGDFSMLRVYMSPDGKGAPYAKENVPFRPKKHLPVSMSPIEEGDFAMVFGFPGRTTRFMTSAGLKLAVDESNPARIKIREKRLALMKEDMDADRAVGIKYAAKYAQVSNYYKYFQGQNAGIKRMKTVDNKIADEQKYQAWADADATRKGLYGSALTDITSAYRGNQEYNLSNVYLNEAAFGSEIVSFAARFMALQKLLEAKTPDQAAVKAATAELQETAKEHFKDYNAATDQKITAALMEMYYKDVPKAQHPAIFKTVESKYKGDFNKWAADVFKKSFLTSETKVNAFLAKPTAKTLNADPGFALMQSIYTNYVQNIAPKMSAFKPGLDRATRLYVAGLREMNPNKSWYPDANSTLRLSYGTVKDYIPRDAVKYSYYTTLQGIVEKEDPTNEEFVVPQKLIDLYKAKDYGQYGVNGEMRVAFITDNDITGGNSGSPVINGRGEIIGVAFDGNWEAMTGDLVYDPEYKRCINVDIKYVLFIVDKFAGAGHLVQEMDLVNNGNPGAEDATAENLIPSNIKGDVKMKIETDKQEMKVKRKDGKVETKTKTKKK